MFHAIQHCMTELTFHSGIAYGDPFSEVELDVIVTAPDGTEATVPAFWAGENVWRVRYAADQPGAHTFRTVCSDADNGDLHGASGVIEVSPYDGGNALLKHGALRVSGNGRYLEHRDGTPFFWLADTWWMGLCKRLRFPGNFQTLLADRVQKGFTVVQIVAGLYPDMPAYDPRGLNEAGFPWTENWGTINPDYFDMADLRIDRLVQSGIAPCIVGCWAYYLPWLGIEKMKQHWRYLIARWGAYPVVWCLAGEGAMPYYLTEDREGDIQFQKQGWAELAAYVKQIDPYRHPVTIHPTGFARDQITDPSLLDIEILQTGHSDRASIPNTVKQVVDGYNRAPTIPVVNSEVCYEGIGEACRQEVQRFMFWACVLSGAAGHTYGANGIWQVNGREEPYGPSPHGMAWGDTPWEEAYQLPGSGNLGLAKRLLERYEWWHFEPHPEWVEPHWTEENYVRPYAGGIPGKVRIIFIPGPGGLPRMMGIEPGVTYRAFFWHPPTGAERDLGTVTPDAEGNWSLPLRLQPYFSDAILVLETT